MDDFADLQARAAQCRRLISGILDDATLATLRTLVVELEDKAAVAATAQLAPGPFDAAYGISRAKDGWLVSRGGDRVLVRSTLEQARHEAHKLAALDDAAE